MKISPFTIKILENFVGINGGIVIDKSAEAETKVSTIDREKMIYASAFIKERFDNPVCLYDLKSLLATISSMDDPDVEFNDNNVLVKDKNSQVRIVYANPDTVIHEKRPIKFPKDTMEFDITEEDLGKLLKFADILGLPHLKLFNKGGKLVFQALDKKNPSSNTYEVTIGGDYSGAEEFTFKRELFKMVPGDYQVQVIPERIRFKHSVHNNLEYFIASDIDKK